MAIILTDIIYSGNGFVATFDDNSVANGTYKVVNGEFTVLGLNAAQQTALEVFNATISNPADPRFDDYTVSIAGLEADVSTLQTNVTALQSPTTVNVGSATQAVASGDLAAGTAASGGLFYDASTKVLNAGAVAIDGTNSTITSSGTLIIADTTDAIEIRAGTTTAGNYGGTVPFVLQQTSGDPIWYLSSHNLITWCDDTNAVTGAADIGMQRVNALHLRVHTGENPNAAGAADGTIVELGHLIANTDVNVGATALAVAEGDFAAGDATRTMFWDASTATLAFSGGSPSITGLTSVSATTVSGTNLDMEGYANIGVISSAVAVGDLAAGDATRSMFYDQSANTLKFTCGAGSLEIGTTDNTGITIYSDNLVGTGTGDTVNIWGGDGGSVSGNGGDLYLEAGYTNSGNAGRLYLNSGFPTGGNGGLVQIEATSGDGGNSTGGVLTLTSGDGVGSGTAGTLDLTSGSGGTTSAGANITLTTGNGGSSSGNSGSILLDVGTVTSGTTGAITLGSTNASAINIGRSGGNIGFYGTAAAARDTGWITFTNLSTDKTCDANATTTEELADILGTLIEQLKTMGLLSA